MGESGQKQVRRSFFVDARAVFEHTILLQYPAGGYLKLIFEGVSIF
jgi:hypothetical protein